MTCIAPHKVPFHLALNQCCTAASGLLTLTFKVIVKWGVEICTALLALWSLICLHVLYLRLTGVEQRLPTSFVASIDYSGHMLQSA